MWAEQYIGWQARTHDPEINCWDFVAFVMEDRFSIILPRYNTIDENDIRRVVEREKINQHWRTVVMPQEGDLALIKVRGRSYHIGVMINNLFVLHHRSSALGAVIEPIKSVWFQNTLEGFYRHASR